MRSLALSMVVVASGCSLTSNAPPLDVAYYSVEVPRTTTLRSAGGAPAPAPASLALGAVRSSAFLRDRIVHREASGELQTYDRWRWTDYPEAFLRRSLAHALFDDGRIAETLAGDAPTLEAELLAFEEVRREGSRAGRVQVAYRLRVGNRVLASDVVTAERPAPKEGGMPPVVDALELALDEVTSKIAAVARSRLS
jgi:cholesterol transport system auxiliary component